jgi:hypothetical protein
VRLNQGSTAGSRASARLTARFGPPTAHAARDCRCQGSSRARSWPQHPRESEECRLRVHGGTHLSGHIPQPSGRLPTREEVNSKMEAIYVATVLKYLGAIITAFYGVYATLTNFHNNDDGKRRLTTRGYFGIALLVCSTVVSLSSNVFEDFAKNQESKKRQESEQEIINDLRSQLDTTHKILDLAANQVQSVSVVLFIAVDPLIRNSAGDFLIPKRLVAELQKGRRADDVSLFDPVTQALRDNFVSLRQMVFAKWEFNFHILRTGKDGREVMWERMQGQDGLRSFVISHVSDEMNGHFAVQCWLSYEFTPRRAGGLQTYKDYNGSTIRFDLEANRQTTMLTTARIGIGDPNKNEIFIHIDPSLHSGNTISGYAVIPPDHFR